MNEFTEEEVQGTTAAAYERLRRYPDRALIQIVIAEIASDIADRAINTVAQRDTIGGRDLYDDIDAAAGLLGDAQRLLETTVLAARLGHQSWDTIGEAVTGDTDKRQAQKMINRYGHLEAEWKDGLLDPVEVVRDGAGHIRATRNRAHDDLHSDLGRQVQRLQQFLDKHKPGAQIDLYEGKASTRIGDYLWRLNAAIEKYGVTRIPPALAADIDTRKAHALAADAAEIEADDAAIAAAKRAKTDEEA